MAASGSVQDRNQISLELRPWTRGADRETATFPQATFLEMVPGELRAVDTFDAACSSLTLFHQEIVSVLSEQGRFVAAAQQGVVLEGDINEIDALASKSFVEIWGSERVTLAYAILARRSE